MIDKAPARHWQCLIVLKFLARLHGCRPCRATQLINVFLILAALMSAPKCRAWELIHSISIIDASTGKPTPNNELLYEKPILIRIDRLAQYDEPYEKCTVTIDSKTTRIATLLRKSDCAAGVTDSRPIPFFAELGEKYEIRSHFDYRYSKESWGGWEWGTASTDKTLTVALPPLGGTVSGATLNGRRAVVTALLSPRGATLYVYEGRRVIASAISDTKGNAQATSEGLAPGIHNLTVAVAAGEHQETLLETSLDVPSPPHLDLTWDSPREGTSIASANVELRGEVIVKNAQLHREGLLLWQKAASKQWSNDPVSKACSIDQDGGNFVCRTHLTDAWDSPYVDIFLRAASAGVPSITGDVQRRFLVKRPANDLLKISSQIVMPKPEDGDAAYPMESSLIYRLKVTALHPVGNFEIRYPLENGFEENGKPTLAWLSGNGNGYVRLNSQWPGNAVILRADSQPSTYSWDPYSAALKAGESFELSIPVKVSPGYHGKLPSKLTLESAHFDQPYSVTYAPTIAATTVTFDKDVTEGWKGDKFVLSGTVEHPFSSVTEGRGAQAVHVWLKSGIDDWTALPQQTCALKPDGDNARFECPLSLRHYIPTESRDVSIGVRIKGRDDYLAPRAVTKIRVDMTAPKLSNVRLTPAYDAKQSLLVEGEASDDQSGLGMPNNPADAIEVLWGKTDIAKKCPAKELDDAAPDGWSMTRRTTCPVAGGRFACEAPLGAAWAEPSAAVCVRAWDRAGNVSSVWRSIDLASPSVDIWKQTSFKMLAGSLKDIDESGGLTPGDIFSYRIALQAKRAIKGLAIRYALPSGLDPLPDLSPTISVNDIDTAGSMLNADWHAGNTTALTREHVDLRAGDKLAITIPLRVGTTAAAHLLSTVIIGAQSAIDTLELNDKLDLQQRLPSGRAMELSLHASSDANARRAASVATPRASALPTSNEAGQSFLLRLHVDVKQWNLRGVTMALRLPPALLAHGPLRIERSTVPGAPGLADGAVTSPLPSVDPAWDGNDQSSLLAANTDLPGHSSFDLFIPIRSRDDQSGGTVALRAQARAVNLDGQLSAQTEVQLAAAPPTLDKLRLVATASPEGAAPGDQITYRIEYLNASSETLTNLAITQAVPAHTRYLDGSARCIEPIPPGTSCKPSTESDSVHWLIDRLDAGRKGQLSFSVRLNGENVY
ncbi:MAG: hypothetical protein ACRYG5_13820 [Janthinobacterium lividum]